MPGYEWLAKYPGSKDYAEAQERAAEEAAAAANEMILDGFRNDPLYIAAFNHGDFGAIEDADFETFGEVKTYIADTIFATEHQGQRDSNTSDGDADYTPSDDEGPKYLDVSEYYEDRKLNLPPIYKEPAEIQMPESLQKYNTNVAVVPKKLEFGDEDYPVKLEDTGFPEPSTKSDISPERRAAVESGWRDKRRWRHNVKEVIGKDENVWAWAKAAGVKNLNSQADSEKIKDVFRKHDGVLPEGIDPKTKRPHELDRQGRDNWVRNVKEVIGKDQDWKKWAKAAGVSNINSKNDSEKIKRFYRLHNGVIPT